jgi:hypothetical protein
MEKEFIPYEQALALKELGFDEPCFGAWTYKTKERIPTLYGCGALLFDTDGLITNQTEDIICSAPLYQQAFRWFRENYELSCSIELTDNSRHYYYDFTISDSKNRDYNDEDCFDSCKRIYDDGKFGKYEEAELECLKKLIEIVKNK